MTIQIGTSGYSFESWRGIFYPFHLGREHWLMFYARYFNVVEINATFYRILPSMAFQSMADKTPGDFGFVVKANRATTHDGRDAEVADRFRQAIRPLIEAGKFEGVLAQFPWSFRNTPAHRAYVQACRDRMGELPYFVEFRHRSWLHPEVHRLLQRHRIGLVCVDEPSIGGMMPPVILTTTSIGYIRLHGRNAQTWWGPGPRYDYFYSLRELRAWIEHAKALAAQTEKTFLFFNNCHVGQAVKNAQILQRMLDLG